MKKKIVCLLLAVVMIFGVVALTACKGDGGEGGGDGTTPNTPANPDNGGNNDGTNNGGNNGGTTPGGNNNKPGGNTGGNGGTTKPPVEDTFWEDITYDLTTLRFKMTKCSNNEELGSGCERYLAGSTSDSVDIDTYVRERNAAAYQNTNVTVLYSYFDDSAAEYGWGKCIDIIYQEVQSGASTNPDMYCNFMTDMLSTSLLGSFANLYSVERGEGELYGVNYIDRDAAGYMGDLMSSLTLSTSKIYVVASDYFIDLIRAFYVVPVNRKLYDEFAKTDPNLVDYNEDGVKDINDFFEEIWEMKWTYERLAQYSERVYLNTSQQTPANLGDRIGFALSSSSGLSASGMVYTSSVTVIHKDYVAETGDYNYYYPQSGSELISLTEALNTLFNSTGVISVNDQEGSKYGATSLQAIRYRFANNQVLFGGVIMLGSLEYAQYQDMKANENEGFGVVPVPLFRTTKTDGTPEKYQTQIHVVGRAGGISHKTSKFAQCTAFLQYQSTHSTDILNEYYDTNLTYDIADGLDGNIDMLQYIRENVRSCFDKLFEDSIGFFFNTLDAESVANRWHNLISAANYKMINMAEKYGALYQTKQDYLTQLKAQYGRLPN